jgi:hypothetical protein
MRKIFCAFLVMAALQANSQVLSLRDQARVMDEINAERINKLLPTLMQRTGIDMWIVISREYNEDPILKTMLPATWLSARRTTMLVFYHDAATGKYEKMAIARYNVGENIQANWDMKRFPDQWDALMDIVVTRNPKKIGLNISKDFGHADGLDHTHYEMFMQKLPSAFKTKVVSAEPLGVAWLETRTPREMQKVFLKR